MAWSKTPVLLCFESEPTEEKKKKRSQERPRMGEGKEERKNDPRCRRNALADGEARPRNVMGLFPVEKGRDRVPGSRGRSGSGLRIADWTWIGVRSLTRGR